MDGWGARNRTWEWRNQNPLPYRLATPHQCAARRTLMAKPGGRNISAATAAARLERRRDVLEKPVVATLQAVAQRRSSGPAERRHSTDVEQFLRRAVGLVGGIGEATAKADDFGDERGEV